MYTATVLPLLRHIDWVLHVMSPAVATIPPLQPKDTLDDPVVVNSVNEKACSFAKVVKYCVYLFHRFRITKCYVQPSQPRRWKSMPIHQGWFTAPYSQPLLNSQSFEFLICILQALNMPLIRCTNVFYQRRLSRHITSSSRVLAWGLHG